MEACRLKTTFYVELIWQVIQECQKRLKQTQLASDIALGRLALVKDSETAHLLIHGTTGTGKSVCLYELLDAIRRRGERAIVYDKSGGFFSHYYREDQDKLVNPLDSRSQCWDLWTECRNRSDFDTLATALIPLPPGSNDPFWINAARTLFAVTAFQLRENPQRSAKLLMEYLLSRNLVSLQQLIKGTEAEVLVCDDIAKVALSIKSVLAASLKSLAFLNDTQQPFSIRGWVEDEKETGWLFVTSRADHHVTLTPLISSWLDIVSNALMSLPPSPKRRIWLCLDELASLQQLPSLMSMLAESRKFGGCVAMTLQNIAQLHSIYGKSGADALADLCSTRIFFRSPSATVAQWVSKELGESEFIEVREGISYGAHLSRDGVSMAKQRVTTSVVMATEIEQLPNLQAYVRLPGIVTDNKITTWPVTKIEFVPQSRAMPVAAFEAKTEIGEETVAEEAPIQESVENKIFNETPSYPIDITDVVSRLKKVKGDKKCSQ
jgi:type IV conjugative transfer system coupling protein TraD